MNPDPELERLAQAKRHLYAPRSRHRRGDGGPRFVNRLIREDSPYLLQHAHNPVDWHAWGDEAFAAARALNRPVFLSIGYATCHWCHVMEEESFDDLEVAQVLNDHFVSIKVDREQRPDLDDHFMTAVQLIGGQGGWPMTSLLTPAGKPFFGATYLPKGALLQLLERVRALWTAQPDGLLETGERLQQAILAQNPQPGTADRVGEDVLQRCLQQVLDAEDRQHGGSTGAPKFPQEPQLLLLLDEVQRAGDRALQHPAWGYLQRTLDAMLRGGIYDQVGGGFHRYATDAAWRIPHFEKMLYNQAQLAQVYLRAWVIGGEPEHRRIVRETLDYLLAEMRAPSGGFHSATDADSEGGEGRAFTWTLDELSSLLTPDELAFVRSLYGVSAGGNFDGRNVLHLPQPLAARVPELAESYAALLRRLDGIRARLLEARRKRPPPLRDEKEITEWNAMTILALAEAGRLLAEPRYLEAAQRCALAIWRRVETPGQLYRNCIRDRPSIAATLADYACYLQALMALYDCTGDVTWLERAQCVQGEMARRFADSRGGGFFNAARDAGGPDLGRSKVAMDLPTPSGNSAALMALVALQARTGARPLDGPIRRLEACFAGTVERQPLAFSAMLAALERRRHPLPATLQYAAGGHVRVEVRRLQPEVVGVRLQIAAGWHLGGHLPAGDGIAATELAGVDPGRPLDRVEYPRSQPLAEGPPGWQGEVGIHAHLRDGTAPGPRLLSLKFQACGQSRCLAPETLQLLVPARPATV